jgi:hypothetical protein
LQAKPALMAEAGLTPEECAELEKKLNLLG